MDESSMRNLWPAALGPVTSLVLTLERHRLELIFLGDSFECFNRVISYEPLAPGSPNEPSKKTRCPLRNLCVIGLRNAPAWTIRRRVAYRFRRNDQAECRRGTARQWVLPYLADKATCGFKTKNKSAPHIASIATISATMMTL